MSEPLPGAAPAPPPAARFALVAVDGVEYAVDAAWVRRSLPVPEPLPAQVPHAGASFRVIDLRRLFGLPPGAPSGTERLMLLVEQPPPPRAETAGAAGARTAAAAAAAGDGAGGETAAGGGTIRVALVVDGLLGIERLVSSEAQPLPEVYRGPERRWFRGLLPRAGGRVTVLLRPGGLPPGPSGSPGGDGC